MRRLDYIDGLRAVAMLTVALFHARVHLFGPTGIDWFSKECSHGVDLFFVLSGFCLSYPTLEKLRTNGSARFDTVTFALKRFLRIVPPYLVVLAIMAVVAWAGTARGLQLPGGMKAVGIPDLIENVLFLDQNREFVNASFWTLAVECRWYFVFPLALPVAARSMRALLGVILLVAVAAEFTRASSLDIDVLPAFLLGIVAAYVSVREHPITRYALPIGALSFVYALVEERSPHFPIQTSLGWHLVAFAFVIAAGTTGPLRRVLAFEPLTKLGVASYSIYLVHEPVVAAVAVGLQSAVGPTFATIVGIAASVIAGCALWALLERRLTKRSAVEQFVARWTPQATALFAAAGFPQTFELASNTASLAALETSVRMAPVPERVTLGSPPEP